MRRIIKARATGAGAALVSLGLVAGAPSAGWAAVASGSTAVASRDAGVGTGAHALRNASSSTSYAGYSEQSPPGAGAGQTVSGTFTVAKLTCTSAERIVAPGVEGATDGGGNPEEFGLVEEACQQGKASYVGEIIFTAGATTRIKKPVAAGDKVRVTITLVSSSRSTVTLSDLTKKWTKSQSGPGAPFFSYVDPGIFGWLVNDHLLGVPKFTVISFSACAAGGAPLDPAASTRYNRVSSTGVLQIATSALNAGHNGFTDTFKHS